MWGIPYSVVRIVARSPPSPGFAAAAVEAIMHAASATAASVRPLADRIVAKAREARRPARRMPLPERRSVIPGHTTYEAAQLGK
jgi:hypothetical protein